MSNFSPSESQYSSRAQVKSKILLQVTGSIAAFKAVALASKLVQQGYDLEVVLSEGAEKFVGAASFEGLTRKPVHRGLYDEAKMMAHIDLERWADLIVVYPASANTLSMLATGRSDSLIGSLFLAHEFKKPYWVAPAMNQAMYAHPAVKDHLSKLTAFGVTLINPDSGSLACGEIGQGRLIEPETMLEKIDHYFLKIARPAYSKHILITSGGTTEPIDDVRSITNFSTGQTGYTIAENLASLGHQVTLLQSQHSNYQSKNPQIKRLSFVTTDEFSTALKAELSEQNYDVLVHAAAVADYRVEKTEGKISSNEAFVLKLLPNEKVLKSVKGWSKNPRIEVISFKLTAGQSPMKLDSYDSEWIIHNELKDVKGQSHVGAIYQKNITGAQGADRYLKKTQFLTKSEMAQKISKIIAKEGL